MFFGPSVTFLTTHVLLNCASPRHDRKQSVDRKHPLRNRRVDCVEISLYSYVLVVVRPSLVLRPLALPLTFAWIFRHHDTTENNLLTGSIPSEIGLLTSLQWLHSDSMPSMSGTIPTEIRLLTSLLGLFFRTCFGVVGSSLVPLSLGLPLTFR